MKFYKLAGVITTIIALAMIATFVGAIWTYGVPVATDLTSQKLSQSGALLLILTVISATVTALLYEEDA